MAIVWWVCASAIVPIPYEQNKLKSTKHATLKGVCLIGSVEWAVIVSFKCNATRRDKRWSPLLWRSTESGIAHSFGWGLLFPDAFWSWNETTCNMDVCSDMYASTFPLEPLREDAGTLFVKVPNSMFGISVYSLVKSPISGVSSGSDCQVSTCLLVYTCNFVEERTKSAQNGGTWDERK